VIDEDPEVTGGFGKASAIRGIGASLYGSVLKIVSSDRHWMGVEFEQIGFDVVAKRLIPGSLA
jgi:hypothetical protein